METNICKKKSVAADILTHMGEDEDNDNDCQTLINIHAITSIVWDNYSNCRCNEECPLCPLRPFVLSLGTAPNQSSEYFIRFAICENNPPDANTTNDRVSVRVSEIESRQQS
jgi:hypothetical protein